MSVQSNIVKGEIKPADKRCPSGLLPYAVDVSKSLNLSKLTLDDAGVPYQENPAGYHPVTISQYALCHWNGYIASNAEDHQAAFLTQARWLVEHEVRLTAGAGGWPISFPHPDVPGTGSWLSALAQ